MSKEINRNFIKIEILVVTIILAFCSIIYELLLANTLAIVTGNYIWWQSFTIGIYIGGLGLGAYWSDKLRDTYKSIINVEIALSLLGTFSVVYVYLMHGSYKYMDNLFFYTGNFHLAIYTQNLFILKFVFFFVVQSVTFFIGLLSGFEIPLMVKIAEDRLGESVEGEYQIFGINYIGTLVGTTCFAYFLLPKLDVIKTSVVVAMLNLVVCLYFIIRYLKQNRLRYIAPSLVVLACSIAIGLNEPRITQAYLKLFYYMPKILAENSTNLDSLSDRIGHLPDVQRSKSLYQYLDIFTYPTVYKGVVKDSTILTLDTNFQFNTDTEFYYHQGFAHVSIAMNEKVPKKVLLLGGGDGLLLRELVKYKEIESIDFIELDEKMLELAKGRFAEINQHSVSNPKVHPQINDGFYYLRNTSNKYDAIFIDFPYPNSYDLARLYSVEFYKYVRRALNPGGFVVLDAPFFDHENDIKDHIHGRVMLTTVFNERHILNNSVLASTFYYAGFKTFFPYRIADESFLFLKTEQGAIDYNYMEKSDLSKLSPETITEMNKIKNQDFPYEISAKYINSIFKPMVVRRNEF
jgi:spermidine synthase